MCLFSKLFKFSTQNGHKIIRCRTIDFTHKMQFANACVDNDESNMQISVFSVCNIKKL